MGNPLDKLINRLIAMNKGDGVTIHLGVLNYTYMSVPVNCMRPAGVDGSGAGGVWHVSVRSITKDFFSFGNSGCRQLPDS